MPECRLETWRCFVAVVPSAPILERLSRALAQARRERAEAFSALRWTRDEQRHITLRFLPEVEVHEALPRLIARLGEAVAALPSTEVRIGGVGVFPPRGRPRVVWVAARAESDMLHRAVEAVATACRGAGFGLAEERFVPHITLARVRRGGHPPSSSTLTAALEDSLGPDLGAFEMDELVLFRSELQPSGPRYTRIATFKTAS